MMKQAIAGVAWPDMEETTVMTVYPSVARYRLGRLLGRGYAMQTGPYIFTIGNVIALASIPLALLLYFFRLLPSICGLPVHGGYYTLTTRRVVEYRPEIQCVKKFPFLHFVFKSEVKSVALDRFDSIEVERQPGQSWYDAGDLVFKRGNTETFRLQGVSHPESFRHTCLKSHWAYAGVQEALRHSAPKT